MQLYRVMLYQGPPVRDTTMLSQVGKGGVVCSMMQLARGEEYRTVVANSKMGFSI